MGDEWVEDVDVGEGEIGGEIKGVGMIEEE